MLRALLILLGAIFAGFLVFGGSASRTKPGSDAQTAYETPLGTIHTSSRNQSLLPALLNPDEFNRYRTASVVLAWPMARMGKSYGERKRRLEELAVRYGEEECELLLASVAAKCRLSSASPHMAGEAAGLRLTLQFVPRQAFGAAPVADDLQLDDFPLDYTDFNRRKVRSSDESRADRAALYAEIARDCRETARVYGNCLLAGIRVNTHLLGPAGDHWTRLDGRATIGVIRRRTFTQ